MRVTCCSWPAGEGAVGGLLGAREVSALLERLPECTSRDACDALAVNFCFVATKGSRKRMVRRGWLWPRNSGIRPRSDIDEYTHFGLSPYFCLAAQGSRIEVC